MALRPGRLRVQRAARQTVYDPDMSSEREKANERAEMQVEGIWWLVKAIAVVSIIVAIWQYLT